jgi:hypothetical protein
MADIPAGWRAGQALFNALREWRRDLAEVVSGTVVDPFYRDERVVPFSIWLRTAWGEPEPPRPAESKTWP